jgi:molybdenum cofactor synthesis domain-containing protein
VASGEVLGVTPPVSGTGLVSVDEARRRVLSACGRLPPVPVPLAQAFGLVLAEPVRAGQAVPPFSNSAMDGYAVRSGDVAGAPVGLRPVGTLMAGDDPGQIFVGQGEAVRIMTGAAMPPGADAVCMVERTRSGDGWVVIEEAVPAGTNVRPAGDDIAIGDVVFGEGERLSAAHVGVLASLGVESVVVRPRPRVGVLSTGDELVSVPGPLPAGKIRDSNRPCLLAQLHGDGFDAVDLGTAPDEPGALAAAVRRALGVCDAVLTSGGVSVGDRDAVRTVLEGLGGARTCWLRVAVKPGKPFAFSTLPPANVPVFGLPGNPVSAIVSYELFARPALRLMSGYRSLFRPCLAAVCEADLPRRPDGRLHLARVVLSTDRRGALWARPSGRQGSHQLSSLAGANALALLPDGEGALAGETVEVWLLGTEGLEARSSGSERSGSERH